MYIGGEKSHWQKPETLQHFEGKEIIIETSKRDWEGVAKSWGTNMRIWYPGSWGKKSFSFICLCFNIGSDQLSLNTTEELSKIRPLQCGGYCWLAMSSFSLVIELNSWLDWVEEKMGGGIGKQRLVFQWVLLSVNANNSREWGRSQRIIWRQ